MGKSKSYGMNTKALHANKKFEPISGDIMPPLHLSTTYKNDIPGESEYFYGRVNNPTRELFERTLASLEGIENYEEIHALAMASGMSAVSLIAELVKPGENVVITKDVYGGTTNYFSKIVTERGIEVNFCDFSDTEKLKSLLNDKTKLAWIESPSNPSINLYDLSETAEIVHKNGTFLVADSTFSTPFITRPLEHGVDIVMHSTTKYIGGHSDTLGGAVVTKDPELHETLMFYQRQGGAIMSPFDSYLVQRGLYTLGPRIKLHSENAHKLAEHLESSDLIKEVRYPGLKNFKNHEIALKQMDYFGGMLSFYLNENVDQEKFWKSLDLYKLAVSLGGVETLIELPYLMTHDNAQETAASAPVDLIRVSVGLENIEDLIDDMDSALNAAKK
jgi:cystathionine gamma-synthase